MAITVKTNVTGGSWPSSGTPTNANTGLLIDVGTADSTIGQAGTFGAWSSSTRRDTQPQQVTSASYVELSSTGTCFQTILQASVTNADFDTGVMMDYWIQFKLQSAYDEATPTPAHNTVEELCEVLDAGAGGTADNLFFFRVNSRNVKGFAPGLYLTVGGQTVAASTWNASAARNGGGTSIPTGSLKLDEWYQLKFWMKRSTATGANDGKVRIWINDVMVAANDAADAYWDAASPQRWRFLQGLMGWGGITGLRVRYAGPIRTRVMTEADIEAPDQTLWKANTDLNYSLRRHWSVRHTGYGTPWTLSGALASSVPARGTNYSSGGVQPGNSYLAIPLTAGNSVNLDTPSIWDGTSTYDVRGADGLTHIVFQDIMAAASSAINGYVYKSDNTTEIINFQVDTANGIFGVNGATVYSGLSDNIRWKVIVTIGGGRCTVTLQDQTSTSFAATTLRSADYAYQNGYLDGVAIGKARMTCTGGAIETVHVGAISVYARLDAAMVDSYCSADAGSTPAYQCLGQRIGQNFNQHDDSTVPGGYDPVPYAGGLSGIDFGINAALSGAKLSTFYSTVVPQISAIRGVVWHIFGADVNDIPASGTITSMALAWTAANTIAAQKVSFIRWAVARGHKVHVTDGWNLADSGATFNGAANSYRRKIPGMVASIVKSAIAAMGVPSGNVFYHPTMAYVDGNASSIDTDGVHPASGYDSYMARSYHDSYVNVDGLPGFGTDSSVTRSRTKTAISMTDQMN